MSRVPSTAPDDCTAPPEMDPPTLPLDDARDPSPPPVDEDPPTLPPVDGDPTQDLLSKRTLLYRRLRMLQKEIVSFIIIILMLF